MGQTSQTFIQQSFRVIILIALVPLIMFNLVAAQEDGSNFVELRGGSVPLSQATDVAANVARANGNGNGGNGGGMGNPVASANVPYGKDRNGRKLILLRYNDDSTIWQLRSVLLDLGTSILDYVAYNTLLIQAKADAINAASRYNALAAEYPPAFKVAPETSAVFRAAAAATAKMNAQANKNHRHLAAGGVVRSPPRPATASGTGNGNSNNGAGNTNSNGQGISGSNPSAVNINTMKGLRAQAAGVSGNDDSTITNTTDGSRSASGALGGLSTWRKYLQATQGDDTSTAPGQARRTPPSPPQVSPSTDPDSGNNGTVSLPDLYAAMIRLVPDLSDKAKRKIAVSWPKAVGDAVGHTATEDPCYPQAVTDGLYSQTSPILIMYFCVQDYETGVSFLSRLDTVIWVEPALDAAVRNSFAGWILQTGNLTSSNFGDPTSSLRPYWRANVRGQGVIVGLEDTGIDMSHCYFIDDRWRPGSLRTLFVGTPPRLFLPDHRKVVQYVLPINSGINGWFGDQPYGHGTHTAGSIAGAAFSGDNLINQRGTGSAPRARLSFFDLSGAGGLYVVQPVDDKILPYHYAAGARISSSSWGYVGALAATYNEGARQFDAFAWRNPDFLSVIAAGNDGDNGFMTTVTSPATAKNVLAVGATVNHPRDFAASTYNMAILFRYADSSGRLQSYAMWPYLGTSDVYWRRLLYNREVPFRVSSPLNACTRPTANYTNAVVLVDLAGTTCTPDQRANNVRSAGAAAVLFIAAGNGFLDYRQEVIPYINDPSIIYGLITRASGLYTVALLGNSSLGITRPHMIFLDYPNINVGIDSLAYFSSYGPMPDGRFKPDIVAPGAAVESAAAGPGINPNVNGGTCSSNTVLNAGTSMSTPLVAGHLALARQYFRDGYYPTGISGDIPSVGFEPSGMLLKAVAIAGARSLAGGFAANAGFNLGAAPDGYQGWGRLDLSRMLPLPNTTNPNLRVSVADLGVADQGDWIYLSGLEATGTGPITAALVWHDYPASNAAKKSLVNDLDFGYIINSSPYLRTRQDTANNVERVELSSTDVVAGDRITLVVYGRTIRSKLLTAVDALLPQRWAVAVVGHFNGTLRSVLNPAYTRPQRMLVDTQVTMALPGGGCMYVRSDSAVLSNGACTAPTAAFTLAEETVPTVESTIGPRLTSDSGFLYTIRDTLGRCLTMPGTAAGTRAVLAPCNQTDQNQKFGFFKSLQVAGSFYFLVPAVAIRFTGATPRCLRQTSAAFITLIACNDDDADQQFEVRSSVGRAVRTLPPSPRPPLPSPQAPSQQWYPYTLVFRADWYPIGGNPNLNDYDYLAGHNGYGDYTYGPPMDDMDIIVSWTWGGVTYSMGRRADAENITVTTGAQYGGDNTKFGTQYEIVYFQMGTTPPPTAYHVCVSWQYTQTPSMRVVMSVYRGYAVATTTKVFSTSAAADTSCSPFAQGFIGTYNLSPAAPPPRPPTPPPPQTVYPSYPLLIRADWTIVSGIRGRPTKTYDFDIVVTWTVGPTVYVISSYLPQDGGAVYGGDNLRNNGVNFETVYWPIGTTLPPTNVFHVCVRWAGISKPLAKVTMTVYQDGRVTTSSRMIDTTFEWSDVCEPGAIGYIDSYWIGTSRGLLDDLSYSNCFTTPSPSRDFSLYFLAQWTSLNRTAAAQNSLFDWDLVVTWRWQGQTYELSQYARFVSGGVHGGDNMRLVVPANSEAVYWPTALTGIEPSPTQYDVCVHWFSAGRLNVTLTTLVYNNVVQRVSRVWDGSTVNSKGCSSLSMGYLGSYTYSGVVPAALPGRITMEEVAGVNLESENPMAAGGSSSTAEDLVNSAP